MALKSRLTKLETQYHRAQPNDRNTSRRTLIELLDGTAARLTGLEFSQGWCDGASNSELAGAAWYEVRIGAHSPALWKNVSGLSERHGSTGKLFSALLEQENVD